MPKSHSPYPPEFRQQLVKLVRSGRTTEELSKESEPSAQAIRNSVQQTERDAGRRHDGPTSTEQEELRRLRREDKQRVSPLLDCGNRGWRCTVGILRPGSRRPQTSSNPYKPRPDDRSSSRDIRSCIQAWAYLLCDRPIGQANAAGLCRSRLACAREPDRSMVFSKTSVKDSFGWALCSFGGLRRRKVGVLTGGDPGTAFGKAARTARNSRDLLARQRGSILFTTIFLFDFP